MGKDAVIQSILGILLAICLALASFSLKWQFDSHAEQRVLRTELNALSKSLEAAVVDSQTDEHQTKQLSKHWRLHTWARTELNKLQYESGKPPSAWPDLGD